MRSISRYRRRRRARRLRRLLERALAAGGLAADELDHLTALLRSSVVRPADPPTVPGTCAGTSGRLDWRRPVWLGVLTTVGTFGTTAAGWFGREFDPPPVTQIVVAVVASVLFGAAMTWQLWHEPAPLRAGPGDDGGGERKSC